MKKFLVYSGVILAILVLLYFGIGFWLVNSTGARVAARRAEIQATGDKVYLTEYQTDPIPDEENAYYYLMLAKEDLEKFDEEFGIGSENLDYRRRLRPEQIDELAAIVDKYPAMYARLEQAAACTAYRPSLNFDQGFMMLLPHVKYFRYASRAFAFKALVEAYRGDGDAALKQSELTLQTSSHLQSEPILISHLVNLTCQSTAVRTANHTLRVAETSSKARAALDQALASLDNPQAMADAFKGERALGIQTFQQMRDGTLDADGHAESGFGTLNLGSNTWLGQAYLNDNEDLYMKILEKQIEAVVLPKNERDKLLAPVWDELDESRWRHIYVTLLAPALKSTMNANDGAEAMNRCLRILLAIEGQLEADLEKLDLPAAAKVDPYSGKLLLIKQVDDEWVIYSVGENEIDDGGDVIEDYEYSVDSPLDIGFGPLGEPLEVEATDVEVGVIDPDKE